jgi:hypothetical protein
MINIRIILISLHVLITVFLAYNHHDRLTHVPKGKTPEQQISSLIGYVNHLFCIVLYHFSCIIAIWYSRRYASGLIRATGILLIGEFLQVITITVQDVVESHRIPAVEIVLDVIYIWLFVVAMIITFRLAKKIAKHQKDLMQVELLTTTVSESAMDDGGNFSLV